VERMGELASVLVSVLYEGWVVADQVEPQLQGGDLFVPCETPMPFGTRLILRQGGNDRALYVTRVDETVSAGMLLSTDPAPRGAARADKQGPKPTPAPPPTSVVDVPADVPAAVPVAVSAATTVPDATPAPVAADASKPDSDDNKKRRGRSRKPTLT